MIKLNDKCVLSPSLICLDMCNLQSQISVLESSGIGTLHVDVLDGHFSPSMPLGFETVKQLRGKTNMDFDCHIMTTNPEYSISELINIGVQQIVFHIETADHVDGLLNLIHSHGIKAGVALKPSTPLSSLEYILDKCDVVLLMLINPGYASSAGESQVPYAQKKINDLRKMIEERGLKTKIEIDGRISKENIVNYCKNDVDIFVCGTTCLNRRNLKETSEQLVELRRKAIGE